MPTIISEINGQTHEFHGDTIEAATKQLRKAQAEARKQAKLIESYRTIANGNACINLAGLARAIQRKLDNKTMHWEIQRKPLEYDNTTGYHFIKIETEHGHTTLKFYKPDTSMIQHIVNGAGYVTAIYDPCSLAWYCVGAHNETYRYVEVPQFVADLIETTIASERE